MVEEWKIPIGKCSQHRHTLVCSDIHTQHARCEMFSSMWKIFTAAARAPRRWWEFLARKKSNKNGRRGKSSSSSEQKDQSKLKQNMKCDSLHNTFSCFSVRAICCFQYIITFLLIFSSSRKRFNRHTQAHDEEETKWGAMRRSEKCFHGQDRQVTSSARGGVGASPSSSSLQGDNFATSKILAKRLSLVLISSSSSRARLYIWLLNHPLSLSLSLSLLSDDSNFFFLYSFSQQPKRIQQLRLTRAMIHVW